METTCGGSGMKRIKTWSERCEKHPDHQQGMVSEGMIRARMQEEIDELRQALVDVDDMSRKRVDEKAKREHEPVCAHGVEKTECDFCQPEQEPMAFDEEENPQ